MSRDDGSTLPLTIFFGLLCLVLILGAAAATSLYLERKRLFTLADGAALVSAEAFELDQVVPTASGPRPTLESRAVEQAVTDYLELAQTDLSTLTVVRAESIDGRSATVTLATTWRPPVLEALLPEGVRIEVTAVARCVFG